MSRVFIVDDSETVRNMIINAMERTRQPVRDMVEASNSADAMPRFRDGSYYVVFLDMVLVGGERSVDLLREMLALRPNARVVVVTALPADDLDRSPRLASAPTRTWRSRCASRRGAGGWSRSIASRPDIVRIR